MDDQFMVAYIFICTGFIRLRKMRIKEMTKVPVFIHHESNEKPSRFLGKNQSYVKYVIKQAEKMGNEVIFFGDGLNKEYSKSWVNAGDYLNDKWEEFEKNFINLSDYAIEWAKGIFKRFFIFEEYCLRNDLDELFVLDSDVLIYRDLNELKKEYEMDVALEWNDDIVKITDPPVKTGSLVCGIGYFRLDALKDFTDFCIKVYRDRDHLFGLLEKLYDDTVKNDLTGGVCEMTILYLFACTHSSKYRFINLTERDHENATFCTNFMGPDNNRSNEFQVDDNTDTKRIKNIDGSFYHFEQGSGRRVKTYSIHFGGDSKFFIKSLYYFRSKNIIFVSAYCLILWGRRTIKPLIQRFRK